MSYALYEGDSRSSWERLDWVSWQNDHVRTAPVPERKKEVDDLHGITREVKSLIIESKDIPPKEANDSFDQRWMRIGYVIIFGLVITLIGIGLRLFITGPFPFAFAAFGMGFVVISLYYGTIIDKQDLRVT